MLVGWVLLDRPTRKIKLRCRKKVLFKVHYLFETGRIRIRIKVTSKIQIRIKRVWIRFSYSVVWA